MDLLAEALSDSVSVEAGCTSASGGLEPNHQHVPIWFGNWPCSFATGSVSGLLTGGFYPLTQKAMTTRNIEITRDTALNAACSMFTILDLVQNCGMDLLCTDCQDSFDESLRELEKVCSPLPF